MRNFWRITVKGILWLGFFACLFILVSNIWVVTSTRDRIVASTDELPQKSVALVLGTSNKRIDGSPNPYFLERIQLAADLYHQGKISHFILSGDNRSKYYNEPIEMRKALIRQGVPDSLITLDFAGLRTLDSIVRSKEIFGQTKIVIVTQSFHCYRALFISTFYGIDAVTLLTSDPDTHRSLRLIIREWFARAKAVTDLYIFNATPHHLGNPEPLN
ncbi:MAG: YdcF family protein [Cyclobacteriaceae bacterium]|nr:YdcF family protein [Cyclobacteriaceae bacterium]